MSEENKPPATADSAKLSTVSSSKTSTKRKNSAKKKSKAACRFGEFGCEFKGSEKKAHLSKEPVIHLSLLLDASIMLKREIYAVQEEFGDSLKILDQTWTAVSRLQQIGTSAFIWRIDGWKSKYELAEGGHEVVIFSPSFYTARHGYRIIASMCPFGDGKVRGQYMSVFIAIVRGQHDALLMWPFSYKIKLILLDQEPDLEKRCNHAVVLNVGKPKKDNQFLSRPVNERNPSFGLQKFIDMPTFEQNKYWDEETNDIFLKIELTDEEHVGDLRYE